MLFYKQKGHRSEQFMFRYNQIILSLDVYNVTKVFSSSDGKILPADPELNPFIGIFETNTERFPILDLSTLVLRSSKRKESIENSFFFQLNFDNKQLLVPVDNIEGIVSIFDEELLPNEDDNLFLEGSEVCKSAFVLEKISSKVYIIENEHLNKILEQKEVIINLETLQS
jgi:hypothetical protein